MASSSHLRIAILGAGKIGSTFAFQLARAGGHDVTVVARPDSARLRQLERDGAIVDVTGARADVRVANRLDEQESYDLVIVTVPAHQIPALLPALGRSEAACVQFMANMFHPELLEDAIGADRCAFGMPFVQATLDADGHLKCSIGTGGQKTIMSRQCWVDVFNAAALPAALEPDMPLWLRCHVPLCVAFESVSIAGERRGGGASWGEALVLARGVRASFTLLKSLGYEIYPAAKKRMDKNPTWTVAGMLWFMSRIRSFRTLLATGEAECRALVDDMLASAPTGLPTTVVSKILAMKPH